MYVGIFLQVMRENKKAMSSAEKRGLEMIVNVLQERPSTCHVVLGLKQELGEASLSQGRLLPLDVLQQIFHLLLRDHSNNS